MPFKLPLAIVRAPLRLNVFRISHLRTAVLAAKPLVSVSWHGSLEEGNSSIRIRCLGLQRVWHLCWLLQGKSYYLSPLQCVGYRPQLGD